MKVELITGDAMEKYIPDLIRLRLAIFREWPYLYDGNLAFEQKYINGLSLDPHGAWVIVSEGKKIIGEATGNSLEYYADAIQPAFKCLQGIEFAHYFYIGELILEKQARGQHIGHQFLDLLEEHARKLKRYRHTCLITVERPENHPRRPKHARSLEPFWKKMGYVKHPELKVLLPWKDIDDEADTIKPLVLWIKKL